MLASLSIAENTYLPANLRPKWVGNGTGKIRWEEHSGTVYVQNGNLGTLSEPFRCQLKTRDFLGTV